MKWYVFVFVLVAVYAVVWEIPATRWGYEMTQLQEKARKDGVQPEYGNLTDGPAPVRWWKNRTKLNDTFNTSYLSDERGVSVSMVMPFEELLIQGENAPEDVFREVYAAARAPAQLMALCPEVLETIAVTCDVQRTSARVDRDGFAHLAGTLRFIPNGALGDLPDIDTAKLIPVRVRQPEDRDVTFTAETRIAVLQETARTCALLRAQIGNCVTTQITLKAEMQRDTTLLPRLRSYAVFTVYADPATLDEDAISAALDADVRF